MLNQRRKFLLFITIMIMDFLSGMEFDLFVPSFPQLQQHFSLTPFWVEALLSVNFLGYCLGLLVLSDISDRFGRKPIIQIGLLLFILGSILCLWPDIFYFLLMGRFLQGLGIAAPAILSFLIVADEYPLKEQQYLMAMLNGVMNLAVGIAPVIGSYLTLYWHWQANFTVLLGMGFVVLLMTTLFIPTHKTTTSFDATELRGLSGYLNVLQDKSIMLYMTHFVFLSAPYWVFVGISPLLYMKSLGVSLAHFGFYQGILATIFAIGSIGYGIILKNRHFESKYQLNIALIQLIASFIILALLTLIDSKQPIIITLCMMSLVLGQIIPSVILYPLGLNYMPHAKGRVSAIIQGARLVLTSMALQTAGFFYVGTWQNVGVIILIFVGGSIVTLYYVIRNRDLMTVS